MNGHPVKYFGELEKANLKKSLKHHLAVTIQAVHGKNNNSTTNSKWHCRDLSKDISMQVESVYCDLLSRCWRMSQKFRHKINLP